VARAERLPEFRSSARLLETALIFTFVCHGLAMMGMIVCLLPGMPGGGTADAARVAYIANHPWLWRAGWMGWQLTAASDVLLGLALVQTPWIPRGPAFVTLAITLAAVVPDQYGQALWITRGVSLAREAHLSGDASAYLAFESVTFPMVAGWGATLYTVGALGWTWCFAAAGTWSQALSALSFVVWGIFGIVSPALLLPPAMRAPAVVVSAANAVGFVLMQIWFAAVTERVMRRSRPGVPFARALADWLRGNLERSHRDHRDHRG